MTAPKIGDQPFAYRIVCGCGEKRLTDDVHAVPEIVASFKAAHPVDQVCVYSLKPVAVTVHDGTSTPTS